MGTTGKGPTIIVHKGKSTGGYWSRERVARKLAECQTPDDVRREIPTDVTAGHLEQDFRKGRGKNDADVCRENFHKMPDEAIRKAMGQPDPDERHRRDYDEG